MENLILTYNNGFGKMKAVAIGNKLIVKRNAFVKAWQKLTNARGGLESLVFDTDKTVCDDLGRTYVKKGNEWIWMK